MDSSMIFALLFVGLCSLTEAGPWRTFEVRSESQACGDKLADILALVCYGRGYNYAFKPEGSGRRIRRGIVDECCRKSCSPAMLELYCRADPTESSSNVQIRKRSDSGMDSSETSKDTTTEAQAIQTNSVVQQITNKDKTNPAKFTTKGGSTNINSINLLSSSEHKKYSTQTFRDPKIKATPNDTTEEDFVQDSSNPPLRHHKHPHHRRRQSRGHKGISKTIREKGLLSETVQTFQIGTVKPYFAGRALASYRSFGHHSPL